MATIDRYGNVIRDRSRPSLPVTSNSRNSPTRRNYAPLSAWDRLDNFVISIGNWLAGNMSNITSIVMTVSAVGVLIALVCMVVGAFISEGIFMGILSIIGAVIIGYIYMFIIGISSYVLGFLLLVVRFVFWNIYSFLAVLAIVLYFFISGLSSNTSQNTVSEGARDVIEKVVVPNTTTYYCTARSGVNIRKEPNTISDILGSLQTGEEIQVYGFSGGYAKVSYKGTEAYVLAKYVCKKQ